MALKTVLLTTESTHHLYYAEKVASRFPWHAIFIEAGVAKAPFETAHPFEAERDQYEREVLCKGRPPRFQEIATTHAFPSINKGACLIALKALAPDVVIVFGTGALEAKTIAVSSSCWNLHGGNPEHYRGLDTNLWTIYHRDFNNLITTLHQVDDRLDTGDILLQSAIPLTRSSKIYELRALNTEVCVELTLLALGQTAAGGWLPRRRQIGLGRYYSYMPAVMKNDCISKFDLYVSKLL